MKWFVNWQRWWAGSWIGGWGGENGDLPHQWGLIEKMWRLSDVKNGMAVLWFNNVRARTDTQQWRRRWRRSQTRERKNSCHNRVFITFDFSRHFFRGTYIPMWVFWDFGAIWLIDWHLPLLEFTARFPSTIVFRFVLHSLVLQPLWCSSVVLLFHPFSFLSWLLWVMIFFLVLWEWKEKASNSLYWRRFPKSHAK